MLFTRIVGIVGAALLISACQTASSGTTAKTVTGVNLGKTSWHLIEVADSKISIEGDQSLVVERQANSLPDRYQERWRVRDGGLIFYEHLYDAAFNDAQSMESMLVEEIGRGRVQFGLGIKPDNVKTARFKSGRVVYETGTDGERTCLSFYAAGFGDLPYGLGEKALIGNICQFKSGRLGTEPESKMLDLLKRLRFDDGALNKTLALSGRAAASPPKPRVLNHKLTASWEGHFDRFAGSIEMREGKRNGEVRFFLPDRNGICFGGYVFAHLSNRGTWHIKCPDNVTAKGTFISYGLSLGTSGNGWDDKGAKIRFWVSGDS